MDVKIVSCKPVQRYFSDIEDGEVFSHNGMHFIKAKTSGLTESAANCYCVNQRKISFVAQSTKVCPCDAELSIVDIVEGLERT